MIDNYFTSKELIQILKISRQTLWRLQINKKLIPIKIGTKKLYKESDIKKLLGC
jgi:DNA-binding Xre family transcriptional regulator